MFYITRKSGFHITFDNGYTVSVQFGPATYSSNYDAPINSESDDNCGKNGSRTAEVAVWGKDGKMIERDGWGDTVKGYVTAADVLELLNWAASQKRDE